MNTSEANQNELNELAQIIQQNLIQGRVSEELIKITSHPFELLSNQAHRFPNVKGRLTYLQLYTEIILHIDFIETFGHSSDELLCDALIALGYNHILFLNYYINRHKKKVYSLETTKQKLALLKSQEHHINSLPVSKAISYHPEFIAIDRAILKWLSAEMNLWRSQLKAERKKTNGHIALERINLPVPQMAYFARLYVKHNIFLEKSPVVISRHMVRTYSSKQTDSISEGSFLKHFHKKPSDVTVRKVRSILRKMLDDTDNFLNAG